ncbi:superoxide dismutase [Mycobacterium xenopi 4042]|uniref:Superoxide dismutase n=1 Tax=Mycobacterium xenopi 4042 TaxID=1299334 RepID=X8AQJ7_MYCXE|nr:superoxide dismutase [Mycobacterium xenopi 4042]
MTKTTTLLTVPVASLVACSPNQHPSSEPGTTPPVHTASAATSPTSAAPGTETLTAQMKTADGRPVATASFDFANGYATVTVKTVATEILTPGFHMMHIHSVGKCEPNSVAPGGGRPAISFPPASTIRRPGIPGNRPAGICLRYRCARTARRCW